MLRRSSSKENIFNVLSGEPAPLAVELNQQVGNYNVSGDLANELAISGFTPDSHPLFIGIKDYQDKYIASVQQYCSELGLSEKSYSESIANGSFYRELFIKLMADKANDTSGDAERKKNPTTVSLENFLGKTGAELYRKALEEEYNSQEYRQAFLSSSTSKIPFNKKLQQRPIVFVAGPSASGKSYAAQSALEEATKFMEEGDAYGVDKVIAIDGGKAREVSQMRKLVLNIANNKFYKGISDLHTQSEILEEAKKAIYDFALHHTRCGLVIPETFSYFGTPLDNSKSQSGAKLKDAVACKDAMPIFTRVEGKNEDIFREVVAFMGGSRAWKEDFKDTPRKIDLNTNPTCESKSYGAGGFSWGMTGSAKAEKWFKNNSPQSLRMIITNDLILKKKVNGEWIDANDKDADAELVSARVFKKWQAAPTPKDDLPIYKKKPENQAPPIIETSAGIELCVLIEDLYARITSFKSNTEKKEVIDALRTLIKDLSELYNKSFSDQRALVKLQAILELHLKEYKDFETVDYNLFVSARNILARRIAELDTANEFDEEFKRIKKGRSYKETITNNFRLKKPSSLGTATTGFFKSSHTTPEETDVSLMTRRKVDILDDKPSTSTHKKVKLAKPLTLAARVEEVKRVLPDWKVQPVKDDAGNSYKVTKESSEFTVQPKAIITKDSERETFEAMLIAFKAMYPEDGLPLIFTANSDLQLKWGAAISNVYKNVEFRLNDVVKVKVNSTIIENTETKSFDLRTMH